MTLKLGFHFLPGDRAEARSWYALNPSTVKFASIDLDWAHDADNQALVNAAPPGCLVVGKLAEDAFSIEQGDPVLLAMQYFRHFVPMIDALPRVDVWEGLNEVGITPEQPQRMKRHSIFSNEFARQIYMSGKRAGIGAWATGNPPSLDQWDYWQEGLRACEEFKAVFTRHNYGPLDSFLGLRHRADRLKFNDLGYAPDMLITECGADFGAPGWASYKKMGWTIEQYYEWWIKPFVLEINQDPYVIGAHLFTLNGGGGWADYDVAHTGLLEMLQRDIAALEVKQKEEAMATYVMVTYALGEGAALPTPEQALELAKTYSGEMSLYIAASNMPGLSTDRQFTATCQAGTPSYSYPYGPKVRDEKYAHSVTVLHAAGEWNLVWTNPPMWMESKFLS